MQIGELCSREVVFVGRAESGMITDRDVAVGVVALDLDPEKTLVEAAMRAQPASVRETDGIESTLELMHAHGVRRLPVVDASGGLVGLVAADDLLQLVGEQLSTLAAVVERGVRRETRERRAKARLVP